MDENEYTDYSLKIRHAALTRAKKEIERIMSEASVLSDDFKFWLHFELIRHLAARFASSNYAVFSDMALDYMSEENDKLRGELSPSNWPVDVDKTLAEAAQDIEFWQNVVPNSGLLSKIDEEWKRVYPLDEKYM